MLCASVETVTPELFTIELSVLESVRLTGVFDDVIASLRADTALARTTDIVFQVHSVDPPHAQILRSIELTATHVAPALGWVRKQPGNATAAPVATPTSATRTEAFA